MLIEFAHVSRFSQSSDDMDRPNGPHKLWCIVKVRSGLEHSIMNTIYSEINVGNAIGNHLNMNRIHLEWKLNLEEEEKTREGEKYHCDSTKKKPPIIALNAMIQQ